LHETLRVRAHERHGHRDLGAIRQHEFGPGAKSLDDAEEIVPATGVESRGMVAQLVKDLLHLESGVDGLNENRRAHRSAGNAERVLSEVEDVVPEARLEMALHLREIEIRSSAPLETLARVVEEVETK